MHAEEMDMRSYPVKVLSSPTGDRYENPTPATNTWKIDYLSANGQIYHEFYKCEISSPVAEIPIEEIRITEKRMTKPEKIVCVSFGLMYEQMEPGGEWLRPKPNDKDPRAEKFYEGEYTKLYMEVWRKKAYEDEFDTLKLTRSYSKEDALRVDMESKDRTLDDLKKQLELANKNTAFLKAELEKARK